jgi:hypothetical protein
LTGAGPQFTLAWDAEVETEELPGCKPLQLRLVVPARFEGVMIAERIVKPRAELEAEARRVFAGFVDLEAFGRMEIWENEFGARSWWLRP